MAALCLSACASKSANTDADANAEIRTEERTATREMDRRTEHVVAAATTKLEARSGTEVHGTVTFTEVEMRAGSRNVGREIIVEYDIQGLPAGKTRGFHIHEYGDCSAPDASSAGGHFNPGGHDHGAHDADDSHAGDLGNITANADGRAKGDMRISANKFTVAGEDANNILSKSVIVHVAQDDLVSQPTGDAGPRAACGVIERTAVK